MRVIVFFIYMKHGLVGRKESAKKYQRGVSNSTALIKKTIHCNCKTKILLRRELRTPSYLVFWNFTKYLRRVSEILWMIKSCYQNVVKFTHFISKEEETNKCHVKYVFWKCFKNSIKQLASSRLQTLFIRRALKGKKVTQTALQRHHHIRALKAFEYLSTWGTPALEGQLRNLGTEALEHLGTRRALGPSGTQAPGNLGTRGTRDTLFSSLIQYLFFYNLLQKNNQKNFDYNTFSASTKD